MYCLAYILAADEAEADKITDRLLKKKLVACVNTFPVRSRYWWHGQIESADELAMIAKTRDDLKDEIVKEVRAIHSYDVPAIDFIPVTSGYKELTDWLITETNGPD